MDKKECVYRTSEGECISTCNVCKCDEQGNCMAEYEDCEEQEE